MTSNPKRTHDCWKWVLPALLALVLNACVSTIRQSNSETAKAELKALQDIWVRAEIAGDAKMLMSFMDERFLSTFSNGKTVDRKGYVDWIVNGHVKPFTADLDRVELHGDTAVVISLVGRTKITWIAVRKRDRWLVVAQTFTKMAAAGP